MTPPEPARRALSDELEQLRQSARLSQMRQREAEQELARLRDSEEHFRSLFEFAPDGFYIHDLAGTIVDANRAAERLVGLPHDQLVGENLLTNSILPESGLPRIGAMIELCAKGYPAGPIEIEFHQPGGQARVAELHAYPVRIKERDLVLGIARDITRIRRDSQQRQLDQRLASVAVLAGGIAHDFNNLLTAIVGNITLAAETATEDSRARQRLREAEKACERARDLTNELLTFANGSAPRTRSVSVENILSDLLDSAFDRVGISVDATIGDELWPVELDESQFRQVVRHILDNAREAMESGGTLYVTAQNLAMGGEQMATVLPGNYVRLQISDEGPGIPTENLARIFDPYFTTKATHSGLGLAIAYAIVKNHGGHLNVWSIPGQGSSVTMLLPVMKPLADREIAHELTDTAPRSGRILLMDDEQLLLNVARLQLSDAGYEVTVASDGRAAIQLYKAAIEAGAPFGLVILDLTVPGGMGAKQTIEELLKLDPRVVAVVSSGYANDPMMERFADYGFRAAVVKPYTPAELHAVIRALLRGGGGAP